MSSVKLPIAPADPSHGGRREGAGRKPLPKARKMSIPVSLRFTPDEARWFKAQARASRVPVTTLMRDLLISVKKSCF